jgi:hypothetical protein
LIQDLAKPKSTSLDIHVTKHSARLGFILSRTCLIGADDRLVTISKPTTTTTTTVKRRQPLIRIYILSSSTPQSPQAHISETFMKGCESFAQPDGFYLLMVG